MNGLLSAALAAGGLAAWFGLYGAMLLATRPRPVEPGPSTPDLGDESPAVVGLVARGWRLGEEAAEATLLDLGAKGLVEFRQPGDDPAQTTVHVLPATGADLRAYERRVLNRVSSLAVEGVVPLTALTFRDGERANAWARGLHDDVVADARDRGLSRPRLSARARAVLVAAAAVPAAALGAAVYLYPDRAQPAGWEVVAGAGVFAFLILSGLANRPAGERDTPVGREVAARWLGVRTWLRAHESFAELPPAATTVWRRYLGYGVALGASRAASAAVDLGLGDRRRVWSTYGGSWRQVRVRYPRFGLRYGRTAPVLAGRAALGLVVGALLVNVVHPAAGALFLAYGVYAGARVGADLLAPLTVTGQVLWRQEWLIQRTSDDSPARPWLHHLAIDDGRSDRTTAWILPHPLAGGVEAGETVTVTVRRWSRRVTAVDVSERSRATPSGAPALLTADEVARALSLPVQRAQTTTTGPIEEVRFISADRARAVLQLRVAYGAAGLVAWRTNFCGSPLLGIADGAWAHRDRAATRRGDATVLLTLLREGRRRQAELPTLLALVASRLPAADD
jgi:hypothetical protein